MKENLVKLWILFAVILLLVLPLFLRFSRNKCEIIRLPISVITRAMLANNFKLGIDFFSEQGWSKMLKSITHRNGDFELPLTNEKTGKPLNLKNSYTSKKIDNAYVYTFNPKGDYNYIILYIHGGGYISNADFLHVTICDKLCSSLNAMVCMPLYIPAPQGNYKQAHKLINDIYNDLLKLNKPIIIMGDSAGGGLTLGFTMELKANSRKLPQKSVLISPWLDVTLSNPEIAKYEAQDLLLKKYGLVECGKLWADGDDRNNYLLSPLNGDVKNLPPTMITTGTNEICYPDSMLLFKKYKQNNLICKFVEAEGLFHAFPVFGGCEEADKCYNLIVDFIKVKQP